MISIMNPIFTLLSAIYIFAIFYWAGSPMVSQLGVFNPMSILHIPLYGVLTILLVLTFLISPKKNSTPWYLLAAFMATGVGILDEYHQSFIPNRDASLGDVFLDMLGISLTLILFRRFPPFYWVNFMKKIKKLGIHPFGGVKLHLFSRSEKRRSR